MFKTSCCLILLMGLGGLWWASSVQGPWEEYRTVCTAMPSRCAADGSVLPTPASLGTAPPRPVSARQAAQRPGRDDFLRAATVLCLTDMDRLLALVPGTGRVEAFTACVRGYLAREGFTLP
jgi:hypothetical protein